MQGPRSLRDLSYFSVPPRNLSSLRGLPLGDLPEWEYFYEFLVKRGVRVPWEYFILPKEESTSSPEKRFVQVYTKFKLNRDSVIRRGNKLGLYEPFAALQEALVRNDVKMAKYYFSLLEPGQRNITFLLSWLDGNIEGFKFRDYAFREIWSLAHPNILYPLPVLEWQDYTQRVSLGMERLDISRYSNEDQTFESLVYLVSRGVKDALSPLISRVREWEPAMQVLNYVFESGREDFVNEYASIVLASDLPNVEDVVKPIIFGKNSIQEYKIETFTFPLRQTHIFSAIKSGNPRIFLYAAFISGQGPDFYLGKDFYAKILEGMYQKINPLGFYQLLQFGLENRKIDTPLKLRVVYSDVDMSRLLTPFSTDRATLLASLFRYSGYIELLRVVLTLLFEKRLILGRDFPEELDREHFPLTYKIVSKFASRR